MVTPAKAFEHLIKLIDTLKTNKELGFNTFLLWDPIHKISFGELKSAFWVLTDLAVQSLRWWWSFTYNFQLNVKLSPDIPPLIYTLPLISGSTRLRLRINDYNEFEFTLIIVEERGRPLYETQLTFDPRKIPKTFDSVIKPWLESYKEGLPI